MRCSSMRWYFATLIFTLPWLHAQASHSTLSELVRWVGIYPSERKGGQEVFSVREFQKQMKNALGSSRYAEFLRVNARGAETPMVRQGDYLFFSVCEAHHCIHRYHFIIEFKRSVLIVCERNMLIPPPQSDQRIEVFSDWYRARKDRVRVVDGQCEAFNQQTGELDLESTLALIPPHLR